MNYEWLGTKDYSEVYQWQKGSLTWPEDKEVVWGVEHPTIITLGKRSKLEEELRFNTNEKIPVTIVDRGGQATLHSPGQLVIYPMISMRSRGWLAKEYVCLLLKITKQSLEQLGCSVKIDSNQSGLFLGEKKICFVGLRLTEGRAYHGLSINVQNDLSLFDKIRSCGVVSRPMTSLYQENFTQYKPQDVFEVWVQNAKSTQLDLL